MHYSLQAGDTCPAEGQEYVWLNVSCRPMEHFIVLIAAIRGV